MKFSKFISYFFHPINFPIIGALIYFLFIPKHIYKVQEYTILTVVFVGSYIFPLFLLFLLKYFKMITTFQAATIEERKFPTTLFLGICLIIGNWLYKTNVVELLALFYFGYALAISITYILLHLKIKSSLHSLGISGVIGFLIYFSYTYEINLILIFIVLFILSGLIISSRLKLNAHTVKEVTLGYFIGLISQATVFGVYSYII